MRKFYSNVVNVQPVHPTDDKPLYDQPIQSALVHVQPITLLSRSLYMTSLPLAENDQPNQYAVLHNQPHLTDTPDKDQEQPRRIRIEKIQLRGC